MDDKEQNKGWVSLWRKTLDNPVCTKDADYFAVWGYLILNATHVEHPALFAGKKIILQPGQLITGRKSIASFWKIDEYKVQRILKSFENEQQIAQQTSNKNRLITITNWHKHQDTAQQNEQQMHNKRTTDAQQAHTNNNGNNGNNGNKRERENTHTKKWIKENKEKVLESLNKLFPNKDNEKAYNTFVRKIDQKSYGYSDYLKALQEWVREDRFNQFNKSGGINSHGGVKAPEGKYED